MKPGKLKNISTVAYLVLAGLVSIATSKAPEGGSGSVLASYTMNYSVRSNCSSDAYYIDAIRVDQGVISQVIRSGDVARVATGLDFTTFGFSSAYVMVGVNSASADGSVNGRQCTVVNKYSSNYSGYDSSQSQYQYLSPGFLTKVQYNCYDGTRYMCSTTFTELPQGTLQSVY